MKLTPKEFIDAIKTGKTEDELNLKNQVLSISELRGTKEFRDLVKKYEHSEESAAKHLNTDYSDGFTICKKCGSYYHLGNGFTKHLSDGCLNCEGEEKHRVYYVNASLPKDGGFPARWMSAMFDDGMQYCKDKLEICKYKQ